MVTDLEILRRLLQLLENGKKVALSIVIEKKGSGPREPGAKMIVSEDGETFGSIGGGSLERIIINESLKALKHNKSRKVVLSLSSKAEGNKEVIKTDLICGGKLTIFIDIIKPNQRLILIGAGHISQALAIMANIIGFDVIVIDDNVQLASKERFPMAKEIITGDFNTALEKIEITSQDFVVIAHGEPEHDYLALEKVIRKKPAYVGLLGSEAKKRALTKKLIEAGLNENDLGRLHAPVGLNIGAQTPEEIAVSVLAEIIRESRKS